MDTHLRASSNYPDIGGLVYKATLKGAIKAHELGDVQALLEALERGEGLFGLSRLTTVITSAV